MGTQIPRNTCNYHRSYPQFYNFYNFGRPSFWIYLYPHPDSNITHLGTANIESVKTWKFSEKSRMDDDPLLQLAKEAFAKYDINASGTIDQKVRTIMIFFKDRYLL